MGSRQDPIGLPTETEIWVPKVPRKGLINFRSFRYMFNLLDSSVARL